MIFNFIWRKTIQFCRDCISEFELFLNEDKTLYQNEADIKYIQFHSQRKKDILGVRGENEAVIFIKSICYCPLSVNRIPRTFSTDSSIKANRKSFFRIPVFKVRRFMILERNIRFPSSEFDIIAFDKQKKCFVFFEVKTRRTSKYGQPFEAVNERRQQKMIKGAKEYLSYKRRLTANIRFDIISILWNDLDDSPQIEHLENAFDPLLISEICPSISRYRKR